MAGSRFSRLFKKDNVPETTVEDVLAKKSENEALAADKKASFLATTEAIESNSGENTEHKTMTDGMHAGQRAVGRFGLMPKTISEMVKRMKSDDSAPSALNAIGSSQLNEQEVADLVAADQDLERAVADKMYSHVNKRMAGDEEKMDYGWLNGHNLNPDSITPDKLMNPRTEKFRKLREKLK